MIRSKDQLLIFLKILNVRLLHPRFSFDLLINSSILMLTQTNNRKEPTTKQHNNNQPTTYGYSKAKYAIKDNWVKITA